MRELLSYPFSDPESILTKYKKIKRELMESQSRYDSKKIAILGGSTTKAVRDALELFLLDAGIQAEFYESEYGQYWQDGMFPNERLESFKPDIIYIHTSNRNISYPKLSDSEASVKELMESEAEKFVNFWDRLFKAYSCPLIQSNFEFPSYRLMGNREASDIHGSVNFISRLNMRFNEYAQSHPNFYINDINWLSADFGLERWSDPFCWHSYKYSLSLQAVPRLALNVANIIKSLFGKNKKAISVDLDNTLWGGVVGDEGLEGLEIGNETSAGQAFREFQSYLKSLKDIGAVLSVNSKNDMENALLGLGHPSNVLHADDFVIIKANWEPKSDNLQKTAQELELLPESFVFIDDNPAERAIARDQTDAAVPDLTRIENFIREIDKHGYFELTSMTGEDLKRSEMYKENLLRSSMRSSAGSYKEYLASLEMRSEIKPFEPIYIARITQLINKSNQFNLTSRRYAQAEIEGVASDESCLTLCGSLADKFGDNGIVSVAIARIEGEEAHIILWLMSCRVLKRDFEFAMMDEFVRICVSRGLKRAIGLYYPTRKNAMVKDFYGGMGFIKESEDENGNSTWSLDLSGYKKRNSVIVARRP
ncbi:MAG: HAD-IIIC family phosphatase [Clostridiales bacterium]|nr:HAD-IIIC family phosphatase [Clostridiales bacterium]